MHNAETIKDKIKHHFYLWKNSRKKIIIKKKRNNSERCQY